MKNLMWSNIIKFERNKPYFKRILFFLNKEIEKGKKILPHKDNIFLAFKLTSFKEVKVVILGQDPYPGDNQAHGLSFSVQNSYTPPSLKNIFLELKNDLGLDCQCNNLTKWALDGVLMLNVILTVEHQKSLSHANIGWEIFTKAIFHYLQYKKNIVYILWGKFAQNYEQYIIKQQNYIIKSAHPSPFSACRGFFNSKPFSRTNNFLILNKIKPINW